MLTKNRFKDPALIEKATRRIKELAAQIDGEISLMEVCGTHTHSIFKYGIRELLPANVRLISGPGCPVCVTPMIFIDNAISLARLEDVIITTYGDLMRVPGQLGSLLEARAEGGQVEIVYSPSDSLDLARENPNKEVVFLAVGFETTTPMTALALEGAVREGITNFKILNAHKVVPPALLALAQGELELDGFLLPGHVAAITGIDPFQFLVDEYGIPGIVAGFEPLEIMDAILKILEQLVRDRKGIGNSYRRVVKEGGNPQARSLIDKYFEREDSEWRGLGIIPHSGLRLKDEWIEYDITNQIEFTTEIKEEKGASPCICGSILTGKKTPLDCPSFKKKCTPETPLGACMVSSEGTCAAYYRYNGRGGKRDVR